MISPATMPSGDAAASLYARLSARGADAGAATATDPAASAADTDRFLTLLVTQIQHQDPLSPMDNAQMTSQLAQISAVSGLDKVAAGIEALSAQMVQMQAMQGAALVGRPVQAEGDRLMPAEGGGLQGEFELAGAADAVQVQVLGAGGRVLDTLDLGAAGAGAGRFAWSAPTGLAAADREALAFRVSASAGEAEVAATPRLSGVVEAVRTGPDGLQLDLKGGASVPWRAVRGLGG